MDRHAALDAATAGFARTLAQVTADQWGHGTPNAGWSVRDLVNHVVGGNRRYVLLLTAAPTSEVEALRDLDHLGVDPYRDFVTTSAAAFAEDPTLLARSSYVPLDGADDLRGTARLLALTGRR